MEWQAISVTSNPWRTAALGEKSQKDGMAAESVARVYSQKGSRRV